MVESMKTSQIREPWISPLDKQRQSQTLKGPSWKICHRKLAENETMTA